MKTRALFLLILTLLFPFIFTACDLLGIGGPSFFMGSFLNVDGLGHFKEDILYTYGNSTYSYKADGSYEVIIFDYENKGEDWNFNNVISEGWVQSGGSRGTYSYDPKSMVIIESETEGFDGYEWVSDADEFKYTAYFTKTEFGNAYLLQEDGTWVGTRRNKYRDNDFVYWYDYTYTYTISDSALVYHYLRKVEVPGWSAIDYESDYVYEILNLFPEGKKFKSGNTVTEG